jgi:ABC-type Zn2+ transport system substrate-binding protein/surface adhesin
MDMYKGVEKLEKAIDKAGGSFKLSVLMQKRLKQLQRGDIGTQQPDSKDLMENVLNEIEAGKVELVPEEVYRESIREAVSRSEKEKEEEKEKEKEREEEKEKEEKKKKQKAAKEDKHKGSP